MKKNEKGYLAFHLQNFHWLPVELKIVDTNQDKDV